MERREQVKRPALDCDRPATTQEVDQEVAALQGGACGCRASDSAVRFNFPSPSEGTESTPRGREGRGGGERGGEEGEAGLKTHSVLFHRGIKVGSQLNFDPTGVFFSPMFSVCFIPARWQGSLGWGWCHLMKHPKPYSL